MNLLTEFSNYRPECVVNLDEEIRKKFDECNTLDADLSILIEKFNLEMNLEELLKKNKAVFNDFTKIYRCRKKLLFELNQLDLLIKGKEGNDGREWESFSDEIRQIQNDYPHSFFERGYFC